jgi:hypothetical protein
VIHEYWLSQSKAHAGILLVPQTISAVVRRWGIRDRMLKFLNAYAADQLRHQLWWLPQE